MIGTFTNWKSFDGERKYRCIVHDTCSDYPCMPCKIALDLLNDTASSETSKENKN